MRLPSPVFLWALVPWVLLAVGLVVQKPLAARWPALSVWLRRRTWALPLRVFHVFLILAFLFLILSGVAIYLPQLHARLLPWSQALYALHVWIGSAFVLALLGVVGVPQRWFRRVRVVDWLVLVSTTLFLGVSGYVLWFSPDFPVAWNPLAFTGHGWVAYGLLAWLVLHAVLRTFSFQRADHLLNRRTDFTRRRFLGLVFSFSAGSVGLFGLSGVRKQSATLPASERMDTSDAAAQWAFPERYSYTDTFPQINPVDYRLKITGLVARPVTLTLEDIHHLPGRRIPETFHCVTGWSVPDVPWDGVTPEVLLAQSSLQPEARYLAFYSADGVYVDCLSLAQIRAHRAFLAYGIAGTPLPSEGGFPLRLIVPGMYGYKSVKWVDRIVATAEPVQGTWEAQGYPANAYLGSVKTGF